MSKPHDKHKEHLSMGVDAEDDLDDDAGEWGDGKRRGHTAPRKTETPGVVDVTGRPLALTDS